MSRQRVGHRQLDRLAERLSGRDFQILHSLRSYRLMQIRHLQRLHFTGHTSDTSAARIARRTLARLDELDLVRRLDRRIGGVRAGSAGYVYSLSPLGHRLLGSQTRKRSFEPSGQHVRHTLALAELGTSLVAYASLHLDYWQVNPEPAAWRTFTRGYAETTLKPDLFVCLADADYELTWFVEIDCGTESMPTIQRKCQIYLDYHRSGIEQQDHGVFPLVLWAAPDADRVRHLRQAIDEVDANKLMVVNTADEAIDVLTDFEGGVVP